MAAETENLHFLDYWRIIRARKEIVIAVFLLLVLTGVIITYSRSKVYAASAVVQVKEGQSDVPLFEKDRWRFDPLFLRTQFQVIQSAPVVEEVVRRRDLARKLSTAYGYDTLPPEKIVEQTVKLLSKAMKVQQYRDTNLIEIRIFLREMGGQNDRAPDEAAAAADSVAEVYRDQASARNRKATENALDALKRSLDDQRQRVAELSQKVEEIRERFGITVLRSTLGSESAVEKTSLAWMEAERIRARMELEDKKARYDKVMTLSPEALVHASVYLASDKALAELVSAKRRAEVDRSDSLQAALGPKHPDVMRIEAVIEELSKKITEALEGMKTGMQADYEAARAKYVALEGMMEELKARERTAEASAYRAFDKALEELNHARKIRDALELRYLEEGIELDIPKTLVEVIEPAKPPDIEDYVSPNLTLNLLLSVVMGLVCGVGLAFFVEYIDTSIKTIEDVERFLNAAVIGVIPQRMAAFVDEKAYRDHAEAYRMLRTNVRFSEGFKEAKTFCVTSGSVGEGKSLTVFNLAYVCAQLGDRTLIVDSDLHRPRQHKILGKENKMGLGNILVGDATLEACLMPTGIQNLDFLPSGRMSSSVHGLLDTKKMRELVARLGREYDVVIFDAPPIIGVSDASVLAREVDGVLMVVQHRKYPRSVSTRAKTMVENAGGRLVGVVLNNINISKDYSYYYHYSYYYYPRKEGGEEGGEKDRSGRDRRSGRAGGRRHAAKV